MLLITSTMCPFMEGVEEKKFVPKSATTPYTTVTLETANKKKYMNSVGPLFT